VVLALIGGTLLGVSAAVLARIARGHARHR